jgi:hypothetical protein
MQGDHAKPILKLWVDGYREWPNLYDFLYVRLQKQSVYRTLRILVITNMRLHTIMRLCKKNYVMCFFAHCNKLKSKRFE